VSLQNAELRGRACAARRVRTIGIAVPEGNRPIDLRDDAEFDSPIGRLQKTVKPRRRREGLAHRCGRSRSERLACTPYQTINTDAEASVAISTRDDLIVERKRLFLLKHAINCYRNLIPTQLI
jgi:hypothetical protein